MEFEHSAPNDSFQDTQKWHRGAGNQACGPTWLRVERGTGILFRAVNSAPGSTKEAPSPGSSSLVPPRWQGSTTLCFILLQDAVSSQGVVLSHEANQEKFAFWDLLLVLPCSPLQEDYKDEHSPLVVFPDIPLCLLIFSEKKN